LSNYFGLSGGAIDYEDNVLTIKPLTAIALLPLGLYFGLLFYATRKIALQLGGGLGLLMALAYLIGFPNPPLEGELGPILWQCHPSKKWQSRRRLLV
jgi:hypothetical protein